ncbi:MHYT domain-containing protein [Lipingzhangella sp. LS1_29]|uniref:MHYT domain-containing protein n=1 Tax=Lipingzhangella rawalii TaxID=2055835 RepID=A0ABU2H1M5_9ACTN|nr:MHYT domain-containing protein [Lipingzhangella rawalii]MDS1269191.1 MHYT domain-containing protein [Lipingzhangella rawalii]
MTGVEHFAHGLTTPVLAYVVSVLGSLGGLLATSQARTGGRASTGWLALGALCIGTAGIWAMHFIAMLSFTIPGAPIRYDVGLTLASGLLAVGVVGAGLALAVHWQNLTGLCAGGVVTGLGVAAMHYLGMASMRVDAHVSHDVRHIVAAVLIAVVAATLALWFALRLRSGWALLGASLLMGAAVSSMHYTGMFGMSAHVPQDGAATPHGAEGLDFFLPLFIGLSVLLLFTITLCLIARSEDSVNPSVDPDESTRNQAPPTAPTPPQGRASVWQASTHPRE